MAIAYDGNIVDNITPHAAALHSISTPDPRICINVFTEPLKRIMTKEIVIMIRPSSVNSGKNEQTFER
ncbi:unnamed protein product [Bursaphelenchus okinawaensis]|uniref:Uncharacterized protein n=1 Tax=Bursaphelenchus okinawaensis TaxID=465554 RepID=A0A811L5C7_9BILA|nr:unnamed protein product [Bursaphelenchus okinawaensis]CAG9117007.1 unnamed protein product [Bursaphelenchus okinawaensis]